jgi:glutamine amidotransferase
MGKGGVARAMIAVVDYGAGNLGSVEKALRFIGVEPVLTRDSATMMAQKAMILPGVGALAHCMDGLREAGLVEPTLSFIASGKPFLGICIGMQMLFDESEEGGRTPGLGVIRGCVKRFAFDEAMQASTRLKVPHMGWNAIEPRTDCPLFRGVPNGSMAYFVHSYYCEPQDPGVVAAHTDYGGSFCSALWRDNVYATQFHPEKSGSVGLTILRNFVAIVTSGRTA